MTNKPLKILLSADIHVEHSLKHDNELGVRQSSLTLKVIGDIIDREKPDVFVVAGDLFDNFGQLESSVAVEIKKFFVGLAKKGIKIILDVGNHEWPDVEDQYFGKSIVTALFSGLEDFGIFVADEKAKFIDIGNGYNVLAMPYRERFEHFERDCLSVIIDALESGVASLTTPKTVTIWHVGLPFQGFDRGDEDENAWITKDHEAVKILLDLSINKTIYCGHYHKPDDISFGDSGRFVYIGSPATRSRSESEQDKRVLVLTNDGPSWSERAVSTGLFLDKVVTSVESAKSHIANMVEKFGQEVIQTIKVHVNLGDEASIDDYNIARTAAGAVGGDIQIIRPRIVKKGKAEELIEKMRQDETYTRERMEIDVSKMALREHFKNKFFKSLSESDVVFMEEKIGHESWFIARKNNSEREKILKIAKDNNLSALVDTLPLSDDAAWASVSRFIRSIDLLDKITAVVS